jgi:hypothetical protein
MSEEAAPKNLYLERLSRMSEQEVLEEANKHGKIMERGAMTRPEKIRAFTCFKYAAGSPKVKEEDKQILITALRVLRLF